MKNSFTDRQKEVLSMLLAGCTQKDIANKFNLGSGSIADHVRAILVKKKCLNLTQLGYKIGQDETLEGLRRSLQSNANRSTD